MAEPTLRPQVGTGPRLRSRRSDGHLRARKGVGAIERRAEPVGASDGPFRASAGASGASVSGSSTLNSPRESLRTNHEGHPPSYRLSSGR